MPEIKVEEITTPAGIEARSFEIIESEIPQKPFSGDLWEIARRCIHALGDISILPDLRLEEDGLERALFAMRKGCLIYTDTAMLAAGLVERRMKPLGIRVQALMDLPDIEDKARREGITRARAGIGEIAKQMAGHIVAIGNAPTALLALLEELERGAPAPALIVGMPVGFVNAAQSKALLHRSAWPHFTLLGRKGGSAAAAACVNAMADIALRTA